ncbi:MAG: transcription elongation factor GreA [Gammaproteobacteria bacterium]|nr:transcription elongation factor GreA [Gammaproteobacteria bacterium]
MSKVPMTVRGATLLREELDRLKRVERPAVIQAIAEARAHGDLRENFEYKAARDQQGFVEGRIKEIESKLSHAQVIDISELQINGKVVFGTTVELVDMESGEHVCYQIVGEDEADLETDRISVHSPIARALIGRLEGDEVSVDTPGGKRMFEIMTVRCE